MAHRAPAWMENLVEVISECVEAQSPMGPLGYRYLAQGDPWELMVYPTPVELVGGADDGAVVNPGFSLDLQALLAHFDRVEAFQWYPSGLGPYDTEGPCVSIEGLYQPMVLVSNKPNNHIGILQTKFSYGERHEARRIRL